MSAGVAVGCWLQLWVQQGRPRPFGFQPPRHLFASLYMRQLFTRTMLYWLLLHCL